MHLGLPAEKLRTSGGALLVPTASQAGPHAPQRGWGGAGGISIKVSLPVVHGGGVPGRRPRGVGNAGGGGGVEECRPGRVRAALGLLFTEQPLLRCKALFAPAPAPAEEKLRLRAANIPPSTQVRARARTYACTHTHICTRTHARPWLTAVHHHQPLSALCQHTSPSPSPRPAPLAVCLSLLRAVARSGGKQPGPGGVPPPVLSGPRIREMPRRRPRPPGPGRAFSFIWGWGSRTGTKHGLA